MKSQAQKIVRLRPAPRSARAPEQAGGIALATVLARESEAFRVRMGGIETVVGCDPSVDPELVAEAIASGARVVVEGGLIVGALATARSLRIDRQGAVEAQVSRLAITAEDSALLRCRRSFLELKGASIELYGHQIVARARELARILGPRRSLLQGNGCSLRLTG